VLEVLSASDQAAQGSNAPQMSGAKQAGAVVNAIPDDVVERQGTPSALPLKTNDFVYWQDVVKTLDQGRVRIQLLDNSLLNIGVRSAMRIVQHDPQSQQTQIELSFGQLRGEVRKLSKAGASFEIQTPTAVIGVVGTVLEVEATPTTTHVHVLEGRVRVRHRNPKIKGQVIVHEGDETRIAHNASPVKPTHAPAYKEERKEAKEHRKVEQKTEKEQKKANEKKEKKEAKEHRKAEKKAEKERKKANEKKEKGKKAEKAKAGRSHDGSKRSSPPDRNGKGGSKGANPSSKDNRSSRSKKSH